MIYIAWAGFYEGASDRAYYDVLLPRVIDEITRADGLQLVEVAPASAVALGQAGRTVASVAAEACANKESIHLLFIHADTGGRGVAESLDARSHAYCEAVRAKCNWHPDRCITVTPRPETEAWVLADPGAVMAALGYTGSADALDLPTNGRMAEALPEPKAVLNSVTQAVVGRRRRMGGSQLFTLIAQMQTLEALRECPSFRTFEGDLRRALTGLGVLR